MEPTKVLYDGTVKNFFEQYDRLFYGITYIGDSQDYAKFLKTYTFIEANGIKTDRVWITDPALGYSIFAQYIRDMYEGNLIVLRHKYIIQDTLDNHVWSKDQYQNIINYLKTFTWVDEAYFNIYNFEFLKNIEYRPGENKVLSFSPEIIYEVSRFELMDI